MTLLVLMDHPCTTCGGEDAKLVDDDACFERYLEAGGKRDDYEPLTACDHHVCANCETPFD